MTNISELSGPVRTVVDVMRRKTPHAYHVDLRDVGVDPEGELWIRAGGKLRSGMSTFRQVIAFAISSDGGLRLYSGSEVAVEKVRHLTFPVDRSTWIKVKGTF